MIFSMGGGDFKGVAKTCLKRTSLKKNLKMTGFYLCMCVHECVECAHLHTHVHLQKAEKGIKYPPLLLHFPMRNQRLMFSCLGRQLA